MAMNVYPINLDTVFTLPVEERIRIVEKIWDSVADDAQQVPLEPWQVEELDRRLEELKKNPDAGKPWSEVKRQILGEQ
jgi:putative addiction module component (TIGR02574 family)